MNNYLISLQRQYQQLAARVNQVVLRERLLLLAVLLAAVYAFWALFFMFPQHKALNLAKIEETALIKQTAQLQQKIDEIEKSAAKLSANPQSPNVIAEEELAARSTVIPMFKSLVTNQPGTTLKELLNLPDRPLNLPASSAGTKLLVPLYEQGIKIIIESNYLATYAYLQELEKLKWMLFWDELQYTVTKYPNAEATLILHTVSRDKED